MPAAEAAIFVSINHLPGWLSPLFSVGGQLGNFVAIPAAALVALAARRPHLSALLALGAGLAYVLAKLVKYFVERGRPDEYLAGVVVRGARQTGLGFVSGHAAVIAALATAATPYLPRAFRWVPWFLLALVCASRVYVGAHLPLDVLAGAAIGYLCAVAAKLLLAAPPFRQRARPDRRLQEERALHG